MLCHHFIFKIVTYFRDFPLFPLVKGKTVPKNWALKLTILLEEWPISSKNWLLTQTHNSQALDKASKKIKGSVLALNNYTVNHYLS